MWRATSRKLIEAGTRGATGAELSLTRTSGGRLQGATFYNKPCKREQKARVDANVCKLHKSTAEQMLDRREFVKRETPVVLEVGAHSGWYFRHMIEKKKLFGCKQYIQTDASEERLNRNYNEIKDIIPPGIEFVQICADEDDPGAPNPYGIPEKSVDCVVSNLSLHWTNDLDQAVVNIRRMMKKDAFFLLSMFGGNTMYELRSSIVCSSVDKFGGVYSHVSPMIDGTGMSALMTQAGFSLPSIDLDRHVLLYETPFHLYEHLQEMGESNAPLLPRALSRDVLAGASAVYEAMYSKNKLIPATFEVFHVIAWSPSPDQSQPLERGSGSIPLSALSTAEHKDFQKILDEFAKNPTDKALEEKAAEILNKMNTKAEEANRNLREAAGESGSIKPAQSGKVAPPFQDRSELEKAKEAAPRSKLHMADMEKKYMDANRKIRNSPTPLPDLGVTKKPE